MREYVGPAGTDLDQLHGKGSGVSRSGAPSNRPLSIRYELPVKFYHPQMPSLEPRAVGLRYMTAVGYPAQRKPTVRGNYRRCLMVVIHTWINLT